jgi:hypothetical protein
MSLHSFNTDFKKPQETAYISNSSTVDRDHDRKVRERGQQN